MLKFYPTLNQAMTSDVPRGGGSTPRPEIPKDLQNRAKLNPIVKTVKNCWIQDANSQDVREKCSKILKLPRFAIVLH